VINDLYNTAILTLAAGIPHLGTLDAPQGRASKTARLCGSSISVDICLDEQGRVQEFAQTVKACALGQAAAAILGADIIGASCEEIETGRDNLWAMLKDKAPMPEGRFSDAQKLAEVANYPQRHTSTSLAFDAAVAACNMAKEAE
jgi:NifU-like protein involved in Fe-S cluster formation